jgi:hypothetical protein
MVWTEYNPIRIQPFGRLLWTAQWSFRLQRKGNFLNIRINIFMIKYCWLNIVYFSFKWCVIPLHNIPSCNYRPDCYFSCCTHNKNHVGSNSRSPTCVSTHHDPAHAEAHIGSIASQKIAMVLFWSQPEVALHTWQLIVTDWQLPCFCVQWRKNCSTHC